MGGSGEITGVIKRVREGEASAKQELVDLVYGELRRIAASQLRRERANHTLQATALVHETYLRLLGQHGVGWENSAHFFAAAACAMRRILVDYARASRAQKRGAGVPAADFSEALPMVQERTEEILAVNELLNRLDSKSPRQRTIVEMRFYAGFTEEEIGEILRLSPRTVKREWTAARAWLHGEMRRQRSDASDAC